MGVHWKPDGKAAPLRTARERWTRVEDYARQTRRSWPAGASAGLLVVAAGCIGAVALLYKLAGPRDVFLP